MKFFFFSLLVCALGTLPAVGQRYQWLSSIQQAPTGPGTGGSRAAACALDGAGNTYVLATARGAYVLDGIAYSLADTTHTRFLLVKYAPTGRVTWHKQFSDSLYLNDLRVDAAGNVYVAGGVSGTCRFEGQSLTVAAGQADYVVAKWSGAGALRWVRQGGGTGSRQAQHLALDHQGGVYVQGDYWGLNVFGGYTLPSQQPASASFTNGLVAHFDSSGATSWVQAVRNTCPDPNAPLTSQGIGVDSLANVYLLLWSRGASVGGHVVAPSSLNADSAGFTWLKLSSAGSYLRHRLVTKNNYNDQGRLAVDAGGSSYYSDQFEGTVRVGGLQLTALQTQAVNFSTCVVRLDPNGVAQWGQVWGSASPRSQTDTFVHTYAICADGDAAGHVYLAGMWAGDSVRLGSVELPPSALPLSATVSNGFVAALDQLTGQVLWVNPMTSGGSPTPNNLEAHGVAVNQAGELACVVDAYGRATTYFGSQPLLAPVPPGVPMRGIVARLSADANTLQGTVYVDANRNGVRDAGEVGPAAGALVAATPGGEAFAVAPDGRYRVSVPLGTFGTALPYPPPYYTVVASGPASATFSSYGNVAAGRDFALQPIANQQDVQVVLTLLSAARPGNLLAYHVQYRNTGTAPIASGTVTLAPDARLVFQSSTVPATTTGPTARAWAYAALLPGQTRHFTVVFRLPTTAVLGTRVRSTATIDPLTGDLLPADNESVAERLVTGSYDPNDMHVNHLRLNTTQVAAGEWLEYTVRFQNHGSDTAFAVLLVDSLPTGRLQLSSLQILAASHNCAWSLSPGGRLLVSFPDILLPSQTTDLLASDGFVRFRARPMGSLAAGDQIPNRAQIHFDYNPPLATNTALTTIDNVTGRLAGGGGSFGVWPNPATTVVQVALSAPQTGPFLLTLFDALGRPVRAQPVADAPASGQRPITTFDVRGLPAGVYVLRATGAGVAFGQRVVVR